MEFEVKIQDGVAVFVINGKLLGDPEESRIADEIKAVMSKDILKVVFDLSELSWLNSRGLGLLVSGLTSLRRQAGDLRLACLPDNVKTLISQCHLDRVFSCFATREEAVASYR